MVEFSRAHNLEIFCSMRMNDTHDGGHRPDKPYPDWPKFKQEHPEYLVGSLESRPRHGQWTAYDYGQAGLRDHKFRRLEEVCQNYDVDGIELDFFRHGVLFKSVAWGGKASAEELDMMTDLIRRLHRMTEDEGIKRGKPILIAVRVPDSVEYCRGIGLDIERWLKEGLVDLLITTCYFRLNPWEYSVELGHRYGVTRRWRARTVSSPAIGAPRAIGRGPWKPGRRAWTGSTCSTSSLRRGANGRNWVTLGRWRASTSSTS